MTASQPPPPDAGTASDPPQSAGRAEPGSAGRALPGPWHAANEGLAFLLELEALAGLAWWGVDTGSGLAARILLGVGTPLLAAVIWGLFAAPRARIQLPMAGVLAVKAIVYGGAAVAVYSLGQHGLAIAMAAIVLANTTIAAIDRAARRATASAAARPTWESPSE
jgi:hypothetical protein